MQHALKSYATCTKSYSMKTWCASPLQVPQTQRILVMVFFLLPFTPVVSLQPEGKKKIVDYTLPLLPITLDVWWPHTSDHTKLNALFLVWWPHPDFLKCTLKPVHLGLVHFTDSHLALRQDTCTSSLEVLKLHHPIGSDHNLEPPVTEHSLHLFDDTVTTLKLRRMPYTNTWWPPVDETFIHRSEWCQL